MGTERITIEVLNDGSYSGEIRKPYLEMERNGKWRVVESEAIGDATMELLTLKPGEIKEFEIYLSSYENELTPGSYRAVFGFVQEKGYFEYRFSIVI